MGRIEETAVRTDGPGQGFIVHGGLIITAAHCVGGGDKRIGSGNRVRQQLIAFDGTKLNAELLHREEVYNLAVFGTGAEEDLKSSRAIREFEEFVRYIDPIEVAEYLQVRDTSIKNGLIKISGSTAPQSIFP